MIKIEDLKEYLTFKISKKHKVTQKTAEKVLTESLLWDNVQQEIMETVALILMEKYQ